MNTYIFHARVDACSYGERFARIPDQEYEAGTFAEALQAFEADMTEGYEILDVEAYDADGEPLKLDSEETTAYERSGSRDFSGPSVDLLAN